MTAVATRSPVTRRVAEFTAELLAEPLSDEVAETARLLVLDTVGCALAAAGGPHDGVRRVLVADGGARRASIVGSGEMVPTAGAALVNGVLAHSLDYDDIHPTSAAHTSAVVVPAALAVAQARGRSGGDLLRAVALGTEVVARIGSIVPAGLHERGFHVTSVAGVFGAAAAAALLDETDPDTTASALGIAGSTASGVFAYLDDATETKPLHAGWAAQAGIRAVAFASAGLAGPPSVIEGRYGILDTFLRGSLPDAAARADAAAAAFADLGDAWRTLEVTPKRYPCCAFMHPWLAAAERGLREASASGAEVVAARLSVPDEVAARLVDPRRRTDAPASGYDAKFSLPYSLAALLLRGRLDLAAYGAEAIAEPGTLGLAREIQVTSFADESWSTRPRGEVELRLRDGREVAVPVDAAVAPPTAREDRGAVEAKFLANASLALGERRAARLAGAIAALGDDAGLAPTIELLAPAGEDEIRPTHDSKEIPR
mgnify:CR=1 FL=1